MHLKHRSTERLKIKKMKRDTWGKYEPSCDLNSVKKKFYSQKIRSDKK